MRAKAIQCFRSAGAVAPYVWGFAAAAALDYVVDVEALFLPALAVAAGLLLRRRAGR